MTELKPPLDPSIHSELHANVGIVPVPDYRMASYVLANFHPVRGDYVASLEDLMFTYEAALSIRTGRIERMIGNAILESLEMQKPYIVEGLRLPDGE